MYVHSLHSMFEFDSYIFTNDKLRPIYWRMNAPPIKVLRGVWFYDDVGSILYPAKSRNE